MEGDSSIKRIMTAEVFGQRWGWGRERRYHDMTGSNGQESKQAQM